jgi:hypothetical protein
LPNLFFPLIIQRFFKIASILQCALFAGDTFQYCIQLDVLWIIAFPIYKMYTIMLISISNETTSIIFFKIANMFHLPDSLLSFWSKQTKVFLFPLKRNNNSYLSTCSWSGSEVLHTLVNLSCANWVTAWANYGLKILISPFSFGSGVRDLPWWTLPFRKPTVSYIQDESGNQKCISISVQCVKGSYCLVLVVLKKCLSTSFLAIIILTNNDY